MELMISRRRFFCASLLTAGAFAQPSKVRDSSVSEAQLEKLERILLGFVNDQRSRVKRMPLVWSDVLAAEARRHSIAMLEGGFFGHDDPVRGGLARRLKESTPNVEWRGFAENVFMQEGRDEPMRHAVDAWRKSEGHRKNMLDAAYTDSGVGMAISRDGVWYVTQIFGLTLQRRQQQ
jgi:uncharacterized protein YkwD